ncbi:MAG: DUF192 domain-containing protein [Pseudomonadota bacterium]
MRLLSVIAAIGLALSASHASATCRDDQVELRGDWGNVRIRAEIADTPQERAQGLMNVPEMARLAGMLFVYERPQRVSFWMENTLIPLDMLFADETGMVTRIHENAVPLDRTPIPGGDDIQFVLEVNGGLSATLGITEGTVMRHPSIPQETAAWPCAAE